MDMSQVENDAILEEKYKKACDQQEGCNIADGCGDSASSCRTLKISESITESGGCNSGTGSGSIQVQSTGQTQPSHVSPIPNPIAQQSHQPNLIILCFASFCAKSAKKIYFGICVTLCVTSSWVGATHCIKYLYFHKSDEILQTIASANSSLNGFYHQDIVAVILCNTGIALLAYMDGITGSPTLGGVVLATAAAAGSAVYKVLFKKVIGETTFGQMSLFFSLIGLCNATLLWPVCLTLYFSGVETMHWTKLPWVALLSASILHLVANMIGNFSIAFTYDLFITLGLITAVPVSAALDIIFYGACFMGMKLAGLIFIAVGFFLVMFPDNWPDYITKILRSVVLMSHSTRWSRRHRHGSLDGSSRDVIDYRTGYIKSHLRSPSGRVR